MTKDFAFNLDFPEPMIPENITYSDMYTCMVPFVPKSFRDFMIEKGKRYKANGHGYKNKTYDTQLDAQIEINSNADEASCFELLKDSAFRKEVEQRIAAAPFQIRALSWDETEVYVLSVLSGVYSYNTNHGEGDHDVPSHLTEGQKSSQDRPKTFIDLLRNPKLSKYDNQAIWSIEVKSSTENVLPKDMHRADLVFLHILGTNQLFIYASPELRKNRADNTYKCIGSISGYGNWHNIKVEDDWSIKKWG